MQKSAPILIVLALALLAAGEEKTLDQLKAEAEHAGNDQPKLCAQVAERLVPVADKQFTDGESIKGHATVDEILQYATRAHDLAIKTRKRMKETEIHLRRCRYALEGLRRTLAAEDRPAVEAVEKKLEQFGEEVLEAMFAPPGKDKK
jgi:hypothetical protein